MNLKEAKKERLKDLVGLSRLDFKCDNVKCENYEAFNQCYNHSHVLCPEYEDFYELKRIDEECNL